MNVLIPGGGGYVGAVLAPWLLSAGHRVTVLDTFWFGCAGLPRDNERLRVIKGDVRRVDFTAACAGMDAVIQLASVSNNDLCVKEPALAKDVNIEAMFRMPRIAKSLGVKRFIYASSVAGYCGGDAPNTEDDDLGCLTPYAQGKSWGEMNTRQEGAHWTIVRSASVCGPSPRMRFDLTVNMMVHDACKRGHITVNGGEQRRSHVHIYDLCDFYKLLLEIPAEKIDGQVFNVVAENQTVMQTAEIVSEITGANIEMRPRADTRSYSVDGTKAREVLGYTPKRTVRQAVTELKAIFDSDAQGITKTYADSLTNPHYMNFADGLI